MKGLLGELYSMYGTDISEQLQNENIRLNGFTYIFSRNTAEFAWSGKAGENYFYLLAAQNYANDMFHLHGYLFLNDVLIYLGLRPRKIGNIYGWSKHLGDTDVDFGFVDFAITDMKNYNSQKITLKFNCNYRPIIDYVF